MNGARSPLPASASARFRPIVVPWRIANCPVGGHVPPPVRGTAAQSPAAHSRTCPGTRSVGSVTMRPFSFAMPAVAQSFTMSGCGALPTVETTV